MKRHSSFLTCATIDLTFNTSELENGRFTDAEEVILRWLNYSLASCIDLLSLSAYWLDFFLFHNLLITFELSERS